MQLNPAYGHDKLAVASLVLGIVSLPASILTIFTLPIPITGIVLGIISLKRNKGMAIAGMILSTIGIILSVAIIVFSMRAASNKNATTSKNNTSSTTETQDEASIVSSNCYKFSLPKPFTQADVIKNTDCITEVITEANDDDIVVNSSTSRDVPANELDSYLKNVAATAERKMGSKIKFNTHSFITLDGVRAYQATATENSGPYKYAGYIIALSPKDYTSVNGSKLRAFIIAYDSATSKDRLDELVKSWHWQ